MVIEDLTVTLKVTGNPMDPSPDDISFSIKDDLFSFFPKGNLTFKDHSSVLLEYRAFNDGQEVELGLDFYEEDKISPTTYVVDCSSGEKSLSQGLLARELQISLIHRASVLQAALSSATEGTITDVVKEVSSALELEDYIVSGTVGKSIWYRPNMTEKDYIEKLLLPLAISSGNEFSPFFAFITSDNVLHFEDYTTLMARSAKESFVFNNTAEHALDPNLLVSVVPFSQGFKDTRKAWNKVITTINTADFTETETSRTIQDRIPNGSLVIGSTEKITDSIYGGIGDLETTFKQRVLGKDNLEARKSLFQESLLITTTRVFSNVHSGDVVDVNITINDPSGETSSLYFSGSYLVEASNHIYKGDEGKGYSELLISRSTTKLPGDHLVTSKFIS